MVFFPFSGRNFPKNIELHPLPEIILTGGHLYPWPEQATRQAVLPTKPKEPEILSIPQGFVEYREGDFEGIKLYASRALSRAKLPTLGRALEILHDQNMLGADGITYADFSSGVEHILGKSATREAWDILNGRSPNRHNSQGKYTRDAYQNRARFLELLVKITLSSPKLLGRSNFHQKIGRGRPPKMINLPSEGELDQLLLAAGLIEKEDINDQNVWKPEASLRSNADYRALIGVGEHVERHGERQFTRKENADLTGCSLSTARKDADRIGMRVEIMPKKRIPFQDEEYETLPGDHVQLEWAKRNGLIPSGRHFETYLGNQSFEYTKRGWELCKETGTRLVWRVIIKPANTTQPEESRSSGRRRYEMQSDYKRVSPMLEGCEYRLLLLYT